MITDTQRRAQILRKINRISVDKLEELDFFVSRLEEGVAAKTKTLSYAGAWCDIDDAVFHDLTSSRIGNRSSIEQFTGVK
jgi:hypothetical protein